MCFSHFSITVANTATKAAYKSRTEWPYSSMIGAVRAQWPGQLRAHIVEPANRQHWRWQKTFETAKPHPQWQTSSNKAILPNPSQTVPPPGDHVFRHLSQWEAVPSTLPQCVCEGPCVGMSTWMMVPAEARGVGSPGARASGSCEPSYVDTGNWTQVLCKSSTHS